MRRHQKDQAALVHRRLEAHKSVKDKTLAQTQSKWWERQALRYSYQETCKAVKEAIYAAQRKYEEELAADKKNPKRLYAYVNEKKRVDCGISAISVGERTLTDRGDIAEALNTQFDSVFVKNEDDTFPSLTRRVLANNVITSVDIREDIVFKLIRQLRPHKSMGIDQVHPFVLKACAVAMTTPITKILRQSLKEGTVPQAWREANVTPIFKKGSRVDAANYRPVSLTSVPCKIMERVVRETIIRHLERYKLITPAQHGFVQRKACVTNLLECADFVTDAVARNRWVDVIYLDYAKAFDTVPHKRLLFKLEAYGIGGPLLCWIRAFLSERKQRVALGEVCSEWTNVTSGVPQGSVLGPILFVIYINDMPDALINTVKLYADDSKILADIGAKGEQDRHGALQADLDQATSWARDWLMQLNFEKCKVMHFGHGNPKKDYHLVDNEGVVHTLEKTVAERDLGVIISSDLKQHRQVDKAASKGFAVLGQLRKAFVHRGTEVLKKLYTTYVRPHLEYAVAVWHPYLKQDIKELERVQRRATRQIQCLRGLSYEDRCEKLNLQKLDQRRIRGDMIQQFKISSGLDEVSWVRPLTIRPAWGPYTSCLGCEKTKNTARNEFFVNRIVSNWNCVPVKAKMAKTTAKFKQLYDEEVQDQDRLAENYF